MLYTPLTQRMGTRWATAWLTERSGMEVEAERIRLLFPLRIEIEELRVGELFRAERFSTSIRLRPLGRGVVKSDYASIRAIRIHADTLTDITIERLRIDDIVYNWQEREAYAHNILLDESDIALREHPTPRTASNIDVRLPLGITASRIVMHHTRADYIGEQMRMQAAIDCATLPDLVVDTTMHTSLTGVTIEEGTLTMAQPSTKPWTLTQVAVQADSLRYSRGAFAGRLHGLTFRESHGLTLQEGATSIVWQEGALSLPRITLRTAHSMFEGQLYTEGHSTEDAAFNGEAHLDLGYDDARLLAEWLDRIPREVVEFYPTETLSVSVALEGTMEQWRLTRCHLSLPTLIDLDVEGNAQDTAHPHKSRVQCRFEARTYDLGFLTTFIKDSTLHLPSGIAYQGILCYAPDTLHALCDISLADGSASVEAGYSLTSGAYALQVQTDSLDLRLLLPDDSLGIVSLQALLVGNGTNYRDSDTYIRGALHLQRLQWGKHSFSDASAHAVLANRTLRAHATSNDSLMQWSMAGTVRYTLDAVEADLQAHLTTLNLQGLHLSDTDIRPTLRCHATLAIDSGEVYTLLVHCTDLTLTTPTRHIEPRPITLRAMLTPDTAQIVLLSGDLMLTANAGGKITGLNSSTNLITHSTNHPHLRATLTAGTDNPVSKSLALLGIQSESINLTAHYADGTLRAHLQSGQLSWHTPQMYLQGRAEATILWGGHFSPDSLTGMLHLAEVQYALPSYNLGIHTEETLTLPFERGGLTLTALPLYTTGKQPLRLDGRIMLLKGEPTVHLRLTANSTPLLQSQSPRSSQLYGKALVSGSITLDGAFDALSVGGNLRLLPGSSIHYIYKDAILTTSDQLEQVVTFVNFTDESTSTAQAEHRIASHNLTANFNITIDPSVQLEVVLGASRQNDVRLQGGGTLTLQYSSPTGLRLSGKYLIESGNMTLNVPLLHVSNMTIRQGSAIAWSGNPRNPLLNITAEERIRASVTLDGSPQSVLFVAGISCTETLERLGIQFTLSAPENASMQNTLATLSPEERGKLSVALLTTGLYLGEGGTGNIMNTALKSILQSQLDNLSRDAFRTVDVSIGIEPIADGVSGVSTRTDYSFSLAKRLWDDRIRLIVGGRVTTSAERIEENAVIDNVSIEWRITPLGNQYLRFFYDTRYENILEGEIHETGVGYMYRKSFLRGKNEEGRGGES